MTVSKMDYKKEYKDLYMPGKKPGRVTVPEIAFVMADGAGAPESACYQNALSALYAISFGIKMKKMSGDLPEGYFEYVVPPLEGLWWGVSDNRDDWQWTSMIRQPEFVTPALYEAVLLESREKKPEILRGSGSRPLMRATASRSCMSAHTRTRADPLMSWPPLWKPRACPAARAGRRSTMKSISPTHAGQSQSA